MYKSKRKCQELPTLKTLVRQNRKKTTERSERCNLLGVVKMGNKQVDLYDRINIDSPIVYVASKNLPVPTIKPMTKKMACLLTKMPNTALKRLGNDILSIYKVEKMHECKINMANDLEVSKHASTIQNI